MAKYFFFILLIIPRMSFGQAITGTNIANSCGLAQSCGELIANIANSSGSIIPFVNDAYNIGSSSKRWSTIYANDAFNGPTAGILLTLGSTSTYSFEPEELNYPDSGENGFHIEAPNQTTGIAICGGNGSETDRGACIEAFGASQATTPGMIDLHSANMAGGSSSNSTGHIRARAFQTSEIQLQTNGGSQAINVTSAGQIRYTATPLLFFADTSDGADTKYIGLAGGGTSSSSRGASITAEGNEVASTGGSINLNGGAISTGAIYLRTNHASADILIQPNAATMWTFDDTGTFIGAGTTSIGWTTVTGLTNATCNTQCTAPCVFGLDTDGAKTTLVACSAAASENCLCAGAS